MEQFDEKIVKITVLNGLSQLGIKISENKVNHIIKYFEFLINRNNQLNLISPKQNIEVKTVIHLVDSLTPLMFDWPEKMKCLDVGSGGGLPALPLSIVFDKWEYTLAEATGKKVLFMIDAKLHLGLANIEIENKYLTPNTNNESIYYDLITVRAVSELKKLLPIVGPRLKPGGFFLAFKGPNSSEEIRIAQNEIIKYKLKLKKQLDFILPIIDAQRTLLLFQNVSRET
ncbi:MAG: 16S rRNA (guanine(527)-N(7))-methyltransferase RsmG [Candidatus Adiutrix sp.]